MAARHRFFIPPDQWSPEALCLTGDEAHHCARVFRHQPGDPIEVFDGKGHAAEVRVQSLDSRQVRLELERELAPQTETCSLTLVQAIPKGKTMDLIVQKSVELGVSRIVPVFTERTVVKAQPGKDPSEKWRRVALEACKQCGQNWLPEVEPAQSLEAWMEADSSSLKLVAAIAPEAKPLRDWLPSEGGTDSASLVIGPEGDLTPDELRSVLKSGYLPLTLGPLILRAETAALAALSILTYELR